MMAFGAGFGLIGLLLMVLFWGGLILLAVWLVKVIFPSSRGDRSTSKNPPKANESASEILAQRYARGEITREQFEIMKQDIN